MRKLLIFLLIIAGIQANSLEKELQNLSYKQKQVLIKTLYKGKEFNYGWTLAAIAWQESKFGKYLINLQDPSCGVFHVMPKYISDNKWKQSRICERLIKDFDFSFSQALAKLKYWENYHKSKKHYPVWKHTIMSYNGGFKGNDKYYKTIVLKIKALKHYIKKINPKFYKMIERR